MAVTLIVSKVIAIGVTLILTLISALTPIKLIIRFQGKEGSIQAKGNRELILCLAGCFSGGVFFGTVMLHLIPDVKEQFNNIINSTTALNLKFNDYPLAELTIAMGFFFLMFVEEIVKMCYDTKPPKKPRHDSHKCYGSFENISDFKTNPSPTEDLKNKSASVRILSLLLGLSFHSIFEGLAVGLQDTSRKVLNLLIAILCHKIIISFSLGLQFFQILKDKRSTILFMIMFALVSPIGIAIGIVLTIKDIKQDFIQNISVSVLEALASGTFLYVTFFEILPHEIIKSHSGLLKLLFIILGFSVMAGLQFLPEDH